MREFLYYILEEDGRSLTLQNGAVSSVTNPTPLRYTPKGWEEMVIKWVRDTDGWGVGRVVSTPTGFVLDSAKILRDQVYRAGIERKLWLMMQRHRREYKTGAPYPTYRDIYERMIKMQFDFSTFVDGETQVDCNLVEGGLKQRFLSEKDTEITLPFNQDSIRVELDGLLLQQNAKYIVTTGTTNDSGHATIPLEIIGGEAIDSIGAKSTDRETFRFYETDLDDSLNYILQTDSNPTEVEIEYNFGFLIFTPGLPPVNVHGRFNLIILDESNNLTLVPIEILDDPLIYTHYFLNGKFSYTIPPNCRAFLVMMMHRNDNQQPIEGVQLDNVRFNFDGVDGDYLKLNYSYKHRPTITKAYFSLTLGGLIAQSMNGGFSSDILEQYKNIVVTSGDALRGIAGANIKTSWDDFYRSYNAVLMLAHKIKDGQIVVMDRRDAFIDTDYINVGEVKSLTKSPARDYRANKFLIGYPKSDIESISGRQSFNNTSTYLVKDVTNVIRTHEILSAYGADPYEIEALRINLDGKTTTDDNRDNKVYFLNIDPTNPREVNGYASRSALDYTLNPAAYEKITFNTLNNPDFFASPAIDFTDFQYIGRDNNDCNFKITLRAAADTTVNVRFVVGGMVLIDQQVLVTVTGTEIPFTQQLTPDVQMYLELQGTGTITYAEVFMDLPGEYVYRLKRATYDSVEGIDYPATVYNIEDLTPARMLRRHAGWLSGMLDEFPAALMEFRGTDKNRDLKTVAGLEVYDEDADIQIADLGEKVFTPWLFKFTCNVPGDMVELMEEIDNRPVKFTDPDTGEEYIGYVLEVSFAANSRDEQEYTVLASKLTDLQTAIR